MIKIEIQGDVILAARPRFSSGGMSFDKKGRPYARSRAYQSKRNVEYREQIQWAARLAMKGAKPITGELSAVVKVYRKYKRTARIFGDLDNHLKALFDGMNQIVFEDDSQICRCVVEKYTDKEKPRAEIEIQRLKN